MEAIKQRRNGPTGITKPSSGIPASDRDDEAKNNAEAATHTHPQGSQDVIVEVDRKGEFVFPVSFKTFLNSLNLNKITDTKEELENPLVVEALGHRNLKKFFNRIYMFPENRCKINFFRDKPVTSLVKLLQLGRPHNKMAAETVMKHAAKRSNNKKSAGRTV
ncbi:protein telomere ends associated-like isoform X2 [Drosophila rhopaloa]|uniref:Uncharacterized protein n=1 Tax=Drosophila rhopaloa TaxID=1041015 RepID=A0ABM5J4Z6_DRORH|nr:protein telomere ends associated-like isoform X2 [Drosophila rhopaloa]XP_044313899.1 protein telomere ends associated-like isoform X2 [Drosophila rhopaloa]